MTTSSDKTKPEEKKPKRLYFNREMSWLSFNTRVLQEAENENVPLLERLRFLSISASNLDEFYMVRVAGLRTQELAGITEESFDGFTPQRQLEKIGKRVRKVKKAQEKCWNSLRKKMSKEGIKVKSLEDLSEAEKEKLRILYDSQVLPLLSPLAVDPAHPFPFIANLGFGMVLSLARKNQADPLYAIIPIPQQAPRFLHLSYDKKKKEDADRKNTSEN